MKDAETILIRWLTPAATEHRAYEKGEECEWEKADALRMFKRGVAEPVAVKSADKPKA